MTLAISAANRRAARRAAPAAIGRGVCGGPHGQPRGRVAQRLRAGGAAEDAALQRDPLSAGRRRAHRHAHGAHSSFDPKTVLLKSYVSKPSASAPASCSSNSLHFGLRSTLLPLPWTVVAMCQGCCLRTDAAMKCCPLSTITCSNTAEGAVLSTPSLSRPADRLPRGAPGDGAGRGGGHHGWRGGGGVAHASGQRAGGRHRRRPQLVGVPAAQPGLTRFCGGSQIRSLGARPSAISDSGLSCSLVPCVCDSHFVCSRRRLLSLYHVWLQRCIGSDVQLIITTTLACRFMKRKLQG